MFAQPSSARARAVIARSATGQPQTYRLAPLATRHTAYRRLALSIVGLDVATLARQLRGAPRLELANVRARAA